MAKPQPTYYEILGVKPGAKHHEIGLAFNRLVSARRKDTAPPDLKAETRLREAFEVLSDLDRRAAYDERLRAARLKPAFGAKQGAVAAAFIGAVAAGAYLYVTRQPEAPPGRPVQEILNGALPAVGRLKSVDMAGQSRPVGVAFAVEEGVLVTSCQGVSPSEQLVVTIAPRSVAAHVTLTDEALGLCKLEVPGAGSWPLAVSSVEAKAGDKVYATRLNAQGEVVLEEARVRRVLSGAKGRMIDASVKLPEGNGGAPLLDIYGRVVGVATAGADGEGSHVALSSAWAQTPLPPPKPVPAPEPETAGEPKAADPDAPPPLPGSIKISPERRERLEKAFRPPPNVPDDL